MSRRIVINGRFLGRPTTGVERFALETVRAMDELHGSGHPLLDGVRLVLAAPRSSTIPHRFESIDIERTGRLAGHGWEQIELPLFAGRDAVVNLCNTGPLLKRRSVTCVHDAHVWIAPENFSASFRLAYKALLPAMLRRHRRWTTVSRYSEGQLRRYGVASRPASALSPCGSEHVAGWDAGRSTLSPAALPERFVFALSSRSPLKNGGLIVELAGRLQPTGIAVVSAGSSNARVFGAAAPAAPSPGNLVELGRVTDDDIALLMSKARCFVFPSFHEGFGLPPIEAMALGCPVIASDRSALPEVLGDAALLRSPDDGEAWAAAVISLCSDEALRSEQARRGRERAARFRWSETAATMLELAVSA